MLARSWQQPQSAVMLYAQRGVVARSSRLLAAIAQVFRNGRVFGKQRPLNISGAAQIAVHIMSTTVKATTWSPGSGSGDVPIQRLAKGAAEQQRAMADDRPEHPGCHSFGRWLRSRLPAQHLVDKRFLDGSP